MPLPASTNPRSSFSIVKSLPPTANWTVGRWSTVVEDGYNQPYVHLSTLYTTNGSVWTYLGLTTLLRTGNGAIDRFTDCVVDKGEGGTGVGNGCVACALDYFAVYTCAGRLELPEALRVVDRRVVNLLAGSVHNVLVDVAEGVEGLPTVWVVLVAPGA